MYKFTDRQTFNSSNQATFTFTSTYLYIYLNSPKQSRYIVSKVSYIPPISNTPDITLVEYLSSIPALGGSKSKVGLRGYIP